MQKFLGYQPPPPIEPAVRSTHLPHFSPLDSSHYPPQALLPPCSHAGEMSPRKPSDMMAKKIVKCYTIQYLKLHRCSQRMVKNGYSKNVNTRISYQTNRRLHLPLLSLSLFTSPFSPSLRPSLSVYSMTFLPLLFQTALSAAPSRPGSSYFQPTTCVGP